MTFMCFHAFVYFAKEEKTELIFSARNVSSANIMISFRLEI